MFLEAIVGKFLTRGGGVRNDDAWWERFFGGGGVSSTAGVCVSEDSALAFSAVYRAVCLIAGTIATLPIHVFRRTSDTNRERISDHPLELLLNYRPNEYMDGLTFREAMQSNVLRWGNAYAEIQRAGPKVVGLYPLNPSKVQPKILEDGQLIYEVKNAYGQLTKLNSASVLHLKNLSPDGLVGWSVVRLAREGIGLGLATERYGGSFFGNGSRPGGILKSKMRLDKKARDTLREEWTAIHGGPNSGGQVAILSGDMDWMPTSIPPEDAQFLETRKFQVDEIARWYGVPPHLLADLERATFSNIEHQGLEFLNYCLRYWLVKWELVCSDLFTDSEEDLYLEYETSALVRADLKARYDAYAVGRNGGWLSVNDIRARENMNPVGDAGDIYLAPVNMVPLDNLLNPPEPALAPVPPQPPAPEEEPEPEEEPNPTEEQNAPLRGLFLDAAGRMIRKECKEAIKAAKHPEKFLAWLDKFYPHHIGLMREALSPVLSAWRVIQAVPTPVETLAEEHCRLARELLLQVAGDCQAAGLAGGVESWADRWIKEQPGRLAERALDHEIIAS